MCQDAGSSTTHHRQTTREPTAAEAAVWRAACFSQAALGARQIFHNERVTVVLTHVQDCFHRLVIPVALARLCFYKPVRCECQGLVGQIGDGMKLRKGMHVHPSPRSLPVGCSWSVSVCQDMNLHQSLGLTRFVALLWLLTRVSALHGAQSVARHLCVCVRR